MNTPTPPPEIQPFVEPLVELILKLAAANRSNILGQIQKLIYQPFHCRYQADLFSALPAKEINEVAYNALRQTYRLVGPLMARYPRTIETGNFGRSLGELEQAIGPAVIDRKLLIIQQAPKLHLAEPTLLTLVRLMQQNGVLINWSQMVDDARYWNEQTIVRWYEGLIAVRNQQKEPK